MPRTASAVPAAAAPRQTALGDMAASRTREEGTRKTALTVNGEGAAVKQGGRLAGPIRPLPLLTGWFPEGAGAGVASRTGCRAGPGVARLQMAWIPLGTLNLVGFSREVLTDPRLVEAPQQQADKDG